MARKIRIIKARREGTCPNCKEQITAGDEIGMPNVRNREGGNEYSSFWYCRRCAEYFQERGAVYGPYANAAAIDAADARTRALEIKYGLRKESDGNGKTG